VEKLVELLDSATRISIEEVVLHPWAENPKSVGALAASQLGIYASEREVMRDKQFLQRLLRTDAIEKLITFLNSQEKDRREAAILSLSFLSEDSTHYSDPEIAERMVKKQALPGLIAQLQDEKEGMRSTAALCCRNLYLARPSVQRQFVQLGGAKPLVQLLQSKDNMTLFETVLNLFDLLFVSVTQDDQDKVQPDIAQSLLDLEISDHLQAILSVLGRQNAGKYEQDTVTEVIKLKQVLTFA